MSSWRIYKPQHAILLRTLSQAGGIKSSTWFEISSRQRWTRPSPIQTAPYVWLCTVTTTTNCYTTGPRVGKDSNPNTRQIVFFLKLTIHHNNRNKSINFVFMWNLANKKIKKFDAAGNSDVDGDDKLNFFLWGLIYWFYNVFLFK